MYCLHTLNLLQTEQRFVFFHAVHAKLNNLVTFSLCGVSVSVTLSPFHLKEGCDLFSRREGVSDVWKIENTRM